MEIVEAGERPDLPVLDVASMSVDEVMRRFGVDRVEAEARLAFARGEGWTVMDQEIVDDDGRIEIVGAEGRP